MAMAIERTPVLMGKAAEDFYRTWAKMKDPRSKKEIEEANQMAKRIVDKMKNRQCLI
jgi:hypothetical protein